MTSSSFLAASLDAGPHGDDVMVDDHSGTRQWLIPPGVSARGLIKQKIQELINTFALLARLHGYSLARTKTIISVHVRLLVDIKFTIPIFEEGNPVDTDHSTTSLRIGHLGLNMDRGNLSSSIIDSVSKNMRKKFGFLSTLFKLTDFSINQVKALGHAFAESSAIPWSLALHIAACSSIQGYSSALAVLDDMHTRGYLVLT